MLLGKHGSQLSEIFHKPLDVFLYNLQHQLSGNIQSEYILGRAPMFLHHRVRLPLLKNGVGFVDETVIYIARPADNRLLRSVYNGHRRELTLKFQATFTLDGVALRGFGPVTCRRHYITLRWASGCWETQVAFCSMTSIGIISRKNRGMRNDNGGQYKKDK